MSVREIYDLSGQAALVTGAGRGIGRAIATALAEAGARVAICSRTSSELDSVVAEIEAAGGSAVPYLLDITDLARLKQTIADVAEQFGRLDILVNNAGGGISHAALDATGLEWDQMMDVNLKAPFFACQAAGRVMIRQGYGRIVNITSIGALSGRPQLVGYCAAKGGLEQVTRVLALEWARTGVTVNALAPGFTATAVNAAMLADEAMMARFRASSPMGIPGETADLIPAVLFLVSPRSRLVTGTTVIVDGGWSAK